MSLKDLGWGLYLCSLEYPFQVHLLQEREHRQGSSPLIFVQVCQDSRPLWSSSCQDAASDCSLQGQYKLLFRYLQCMSIVLDGKSGGHADSSARAWCAFDQGPSDIGDSGDSGVLYQWKARRVCMKSV